MIEYSYLRQREIMLVERSKLIREKNIFSILVGKNGTGKSTLLGNLTSEMIKDVSKRKKENNLVEDFDIFEKQYINIFPAEIIAVSTSPFDKFPINRYNRQKYYTYLGLRDVNSLSVGLGYLSKIIGSLIESIYKDKNRSIEICNVLDYLGYRDEINIILDFSITSKQFEELSSSKNILEEFDNRTNSIFRRLNRQFFTNVDNSLNERKLKKLSRIIQHIYDRENEHKYLQLTINQNGFEDTLDYDEIENLIFLFEAGVIRLKDVLFTNSNGFERYSIKEASSGEQSIILSILGIASKIKDDCLILIDEPEICLHPQWQETYIDILTKTFDKFRNCQFIIATHSPLIISRLSNYNSFIIDMESCKINSAELFINNSVDFQLANVFNHPGFKNEYLLRIAVSIFSNISKTKSFSNKDNLNFDILLEQSKYLRHDDPVYDLFKTIKELKAIL